MAIADRETQAFLTGLYELTNGDPWKSAGLRDVAERAQLEDGRVEALYERLRATGHVVPFSAGGSDPRIQLTPRGVRSAEETVGTPFPPRLERKFVQTLYRMAGHNPHGSVQIAAIAEAMKLDETTTMKLARRLWLVQGTVDWQTQAGTVSFIRLNEAGIRQAQAMRDDA